MHFDYGSLLKTCSANSSSESGIGFKLMSFAVLHEQSHMVYFYMTCSLPNSKLCRGVDLSVWVDMPAVVTRDHGSGPRGYESFSSRSESCSTARSMRWPNIPFSFNLGYLISGICSLLCDFTFCKGFSFNLLCFTGSSNTVDLSA